ncbi:MAG TPA: hypothetical protein PK370_00395 [Candidatus Woesebacteria bacterium]|nr:hypothetical protein [Candidatus Woesebacteria bacterium]HPJ16958.1 hypothetical protein [Candidatus Woesebacteria bacterium]
MKKFLIIIIFLLFSAWVYQKLTTPPAEQKYSNDQAEIIIYWGDGCPHCENVKKYISDNKIDQKIKILFKEVYQNKNNQKELLEYVKKCPEIDTRQGVGVPLGYVVSESKCYLGDTPIIDWLKTK